ncbi:glycosyltransferase [Nocardia altamirensis]|uniref:glycosyltransferase n=1 Tax=Nocardia altamirensis TaxID=472158 RepID=UPI0008406CEA|nr:glycosyltransferase [Nocardia altamirensis]
MVSVTVVVPCRDEQDNVVAAHRAIVDELGAHDVEVLFVDDGSVDETLPLIIGLAAEDERVHYISFARNFGFEAAFAAGYKYAAKAWILHVDADLQSHPSQAHQLIAAATDRVDAVFGVRDQRKDPRLRRWGSTLSDVIARRVLGIEMPQGATTFRLVRTGVARRIVELRRPAPYFMASLPAVTNRYVTVRTAHQARRAGSSKFTVVRLARHALDLYVGHSTALASGATLLVAAATVVGAVALVLLGAGVIGIAAALSAVLFTQVAALPTIALTLHYSVMVARRTDRALYYVRASDLAIDDSDRLHLERVTIGGGVR